MPTCCSEPLLLWRLRLLRKPRYVSPCPFRRRGRDLQPDGVTVIFAARLALFCNTWPRYVSVVWASARHCLQVVTSQTLSQLYVARLSAVQWLIACMIFLICQNTIVESCSIRWSYV